MFFSPPRLLSLPTLTPPHPSFPLFSSSFLITAILPLPPPHLRFSVSSLLSSLTSPRFKPHSSFPPLLPPPSSSSYFGDSVAAGVGMRACLTELCMRGLSNFYSDSKKRIRTSYQSKSGLPKGRGSRCMCVGVWVGVLMDIVRHDVWSRLLPQELTRTRSPGQTTDMTGIKRDVTCRALSIPVMSSSLSFAEEDTSLRQQSKRSYK